MFSLNFDDERRGRMKSYNECVVVIVAGCLALETVLSHGKLHVQLEQYRPVNVQMLTTSVATPGASVSWPTDMP
jgi:hypothetical protein